MPIVEQNIKVKKLGEEVCLGQITLRLKNKRETGPVKPSEVETHEGLIYQKPKRKQQSSPFEAFKVIKLHKWTGC